MHLSFVDANFQVMVPVGWINEWVHNEWCSLTCKGERSAVLNMRCLVYQSSSVCRWTCVLSVCELRQYLDFLQHVCEWVFGSHMNHLACWVGAEQRSGRESRTGGPDPADDSVNGVITTIPPSPQYKQEVTDVAALTFAVSSSYFLHSSSIICLSVLRICWCCFCFFLLSWMVLQTKMLPTLQCFEWFYRGRCFFLDWNCNKAKKWAFNCMQIQKKRDIIAFFPCEPDKFWFLCLCTHYELVYLMSCSLFPLCKFHNIP